MRQEDVSMRIAHAIGVCIVGALLVLAANPADAKKKEVIERFHGNAMSLDVGRAAQVQIGIYEWTSDEERQALIQAFNQGGNEAAYKHLGKLEDKGYLRGAQTMGYQMRYAYQFESDGKRQIVLATDRPISFGEAMTGSWSQENNISFVVLQLDKETGEGVGQVVFGAEFKVNEKTGQLEIETLSHNPTKLTDVKPQKVKHKD